MLRLFNFLVEGFGFQNFQDFKNSSFGFMKSWYVVEFSTLFGVIKLFVLDYLGIDMLVLSSFVILNFMEFFSGLKVARKIKKERVESRKMGRMFLKVGTYVLIIHILNSFKTRIEFPSISGIELDVFELMYWGFFAGINYQLFMSLLENYAALGYKEAGGVFSFLKRKMGNTFSSDKDKNE